MSIFSRFLVKKRYQVFGTFRRVSSPNFWRLVYLGILDRVTLIPADLIDESWVYQEIVDLKFKFTNK